MGIQEVRFEACQIFIKARNCSDEDEAQRLIEEGLRLSALADQQEAWLQGSRNRIWSAGQNDAEERSPANA